jgi:hypothetical protein
MLQLPKVAEGPSRLFALRRRKGVRRIVVAVRRGVDPYENPYETVRTSCVAGK